MFADNTTVQISENSRFRVDQFQFEPVTQTGQSFFGFLSGAFRYVSGLIGKEPKDNNVIEWDFGAIGIRGTELIARQNTTTGLREIYLIDGAIAVPADNPQEIPAPRRYSST